MAKGKRRKLRHKTDGPLLSAQDVRFAQLVLNRGSKTLAECYVEAGFAPRSTPNATKEAARRLVANRCWREYFRTLQSDATADAGVNAAYLVAGFKSAVDFDPAVIFARDGALKPLDDWPECARKCVKRIKRKPIFETVPDPDDADKKRRVKVDEEWDIVFEDRTDCRKTLCHIRGLIGPDAVQQTQGHKPLVVKGADPDKL